MFQHDMPSTADFLAKGGAVTVLPMGVADNILTADDMRAEMLESDGRREYLISSGCMIRKNIPI